MSKKYAGQLSWKESSGISSIPVMQIRHRSVVMYYELLNHSSRRNNKKTFQWHSKNLNKTAYSGTVTVGVRKRMTKALNVMLQTLQPKWITNPVSNKLQYHKLSFLTLKISHCKQVTGRQAYDLCLNHFLDWLTRTKGVEQYVWKLEPQEDSQIHYHITTPAFIHWQEIKDKWNELQRKAGFLDDYAKEHGHYHANSTDIHEVIGITDLASYMVKAFADSLKEAEKRKKKETGRDISAEMGKDIKEVESTDGKIWGCSELLSAAHYVSYHMNSRHLEMLEQLKNEKRVREVADPNGRWCVWYFADCSPPEIMSDAEQLYVKMYLKWQMKFPGKSCAPQELIDWANKKPFLN